MKTKFALAALLIVSLSVSVHAANKAGIVIKNSTDEVITRCVEFEENELTLEELLTRSGFKFVTDQVENETVLCYLHDDGTEQYTMLLGGRVWNLLRHDGENWFPALEGFASAKVQNGELIGFVYASSGTAYQPELSVKTFAEVCEITSKAALVIDHNDGMRRIEVVEFPGETITGWQLLHRSGIDVIHQVSSFGIAVCAIDGEGQPSDDCFGDPQGRYWGLNVLSEDNSWIAPPVGVADTVIRSMDVQGWFYASWGDLQSPVIRQEIWNGSTGVPFWALYE